MRVTKTTGIGFKPVFLSILEGIVGGVKLATTELPTNVYRLPRGTLLSTTSTAKVYQPLKVAKSCETQTAGTALRFTRNDNPLLFKVGEFIAKYAATTGSTITRITNSANTVVIATSSSLGTLATATRILEVAAAGATLKKYTPSAILKDTVTVREEDGTTLDNVLVAAVLRGSVQESALDYYVTAADKTSLDDRLRFE